MTAHISSAQCQTIADWARRMRAPGLADAAAVVSHDIAPGAPRMDDEHRKVFLHADDFLALRRWADRQAVAR